MFEFDRRLLLRFAQDRSFRPEFFEKALRLVRYLADVSSHPYLGPRLVLRGGTAINLFLADAPRLSVDIDLNYIGAEDRQGTDRERTRVQELLKEVGRSQGYTLAEGSREYANENFYLLYPSVRGVKDKLKVETNYLMRIPLLPVIRKEATPLLEGLECEFNLSSAEEIYAGKVKALIERGAPRDFFDVYRLLQDGELPGTEVVRGLTTFYLATIPDGPREFTVSTIPWPSEKQLGSHLRNLLRIGYVLPVRELVARVKSYLASILKLDERQSAFLDAVMAGRAEAGLLFTDNKLLADRASRHPALLWKVQNIGRARRRNR